MSNISPDDLQIVETSDGSQTIHNKTTGSTFHSIHGALTESQHIFIDKGFEKILESGLTRISILEMGLGTGLNALLTAILAEKKRIEVNYHAIELHPLPSSIWREFTLPFGLQNHRDLYDQIHLHEWGNKVELNSFFKLTKHHISLLEFNSNNKFDLVYFDAFDPIRQPELWTVEQFTRMAERMNQGAILTTYCCKGYVKRNMLASGLRVEKIPGPPGKREIIRAHRTF